MSVSVMCVLLVLTYLVTTADSGLLVINTIISGGGSETENKHRIICGVIVTAVVGFFGLLLAMLVLMLIH